MNDLGSTIRDLRRRAGLTQAQLAVAIGIAPTSIYRYEAGLTKPDLRTIQKLFLFADKHQDEMAKKVFQQEIQEDGDVLITGAEGSAIRLEGRESPPSLPHLRVSHMLLTPRERLLVIAFILLLRNNVDDSAENMMRLLLEPWMKAAKEEFDATVTPDGIRHLIEAKFLPTCRIDRRVQIRRVDLDRLMERNTQ